MQGIKIQWGLLIIFLITLPGCGRIINWGKSNFYQGKDVDDYSGQARPFIRSVTLYDQLETQARFEVLWLNDQVRTAYVRLHTARQAKDDEKFYASLRRQLEENNNYISFYVLSTHDIKLGVPESHWSIYLDVDGALYFPLEIKEVELPYEYQIFFGKKWNRFKVPYIVRFYAFNEKEEPIVSDTSAQLSLVFRSAQKEHDFVWQMQPEEEKIILYKQRHQKKRIERKRKKMRQNRNVRKARK